MVSVFHMLSRQEPYRELGANYFDERRRQFTVDRLTRRIVHLGYRVHLEPSGSARRCKKFSRQPTHFSITKKVDKGGLVFQPPVGAFEHVAELDFAAMYPTIMVQHNISAETLFCRCCDNHAVPEAGYTICERPEGLMATMLRPLIGCRDYYKIRLKEGGITPEAAALYDRRQRAHKWIGVTCFGYFGYRNARFGRIESHEAVTAFGREKLLQAKEICEAHGYELLHALTDSVWMRQSGLTDEALQALSSLVEPRDWCPAPLLLPSACVC